ncbi:hypothetical protein HYW94_03610 [Candidatus Uhrbacteria bacterium]|nr:hypothetical protein [Candidatus Uhrbacteria bacterium]
MSARKTQSHIIELWKRLLAHDPNCSDLGNVIKNIPLLREAAAKEILARHDATNEDVLCVMRYCEEVRIAAWDRFVLRNPSDIHLRYVIENITPLAEVAGRILLDRMPAQNFLFCIMEHIPLLCHEAWEYYQDQLPTHDELCWVIRYIPALQTEAGTLLLRRNPRNTDLRCVMVKVHNLAIEAGRMLLQQSPSKNDIQCVLDHVPQLKDEANRILMRHVSEEELRRLIEVCGEHVSEYADRELQRRTTKLSLTDKKYLRSHVPLSESEVERRQNERIRAHILDELLILGCKTS